MHNWKGSFGKFVSWTDGSPLPDLSILDFPHGTLSKQSLYCQNNQIWNCIINVIKCITKTCEFCIGENGNKFEQVV